MDTAAEKEARRGEIEVFYSQIRESIEANYVDDKRNLEEVYHEDIASNEKDRRGALIAAGLNPDGSDPQGRPQGNQI